MLRSSNSDPAPALMLGVLLGLWFFFKGFRVMREYRVLADTPRMPIRSVPMGFVHIRGKAESAQALTSPLTHTPCCFYRVEIDQWKSAEHNTHEWKRICTDIGGYQFHLRDDTGAILVDAHAADYDIPLTVERKVSSNSRSVSADDSKLLEYVTQAQAHSMTDRVGQWIDKRFENKHADDNPDSHAKRQAFRELFDGMSSAQQGGKLPFEAMEKLFNATGPLADPEKEQHRQQMLQRMQLAKTASAAGLLDDFMQRENRAASGSFRLREYVVTPGQEYLISGTCVENTDDRTLAQDRSLIAKGKNEPTFVISTKTDAQIHSALEKRALKMIFGGAIAAIAFAAGLFLRFGMFK